MGQPVVHFEVMGKDGAGLRSFYSDLFDWKIDFDSSLNYGVVRRTGDGTVDGAGIGGGIGVAPEGCLGHVTFYVGVPDVEAALAKAESLGGSRMMGPEKGPAGDGPFVMRAVAAQVPRNTAQSRRSLIVESELWPCSPERPQLTFDDQAPRRDDNGAPGVDAGGQPHHACLVCSVQARREAAECGDHC